MCLIPARMWNDPLSLLAQHRDIQFSDTVLNFKCYRVKLLLGPWAWAGTWIRFNVQFSVHTKECLGELGCSVFRCQFQSTVVVIIAQVQLNSIQITSDPTCQLMCWAVRLCGWAVDFSVHM
jgi:hypothetical protein